MNTTVIFLAGYILIGCAFLACQFLARRPGAPVAKLGDVLRVIKRSRAGWIVLVLAWWWIGFHVLARSSALEP